MPTHKVGGEVDALCGRCKMTLAHTILAMVGTTIARVQCNTCGAQHGFKTETGATTARARNAASAGSQAIRAASRESLVKTVISFEEQLRGKDVDKARRYSPRDTYVLDELIQHPTFGYGLVRAVRPDKVDVAFKASEKTLVHGRGEAPAQKPAFSQAARPAQAGVADKPPPPEAAAGAPPAAAPEAED
jgi:hypothetical protein